MPSACPGAERELLMRFIAAVGRRRDSCLRRFRVSPGRRIANRAAAVHDTDKLTDLDGFHADFATGFTASGWWDRHRSLNRHHLTLADGVPADVNLIDVLDYIADCVMAGMARSGSVYALSLPPELLATAFQNTVNLLTAAVVVDVPAPVDPSATPTRNTRT